MGASSQTSSVGKLSSQPFASSSFPPPSTPSSASSSSPFSAGPRVFSSFSVHKSRAAVQLGFQPPRLQQKLSRSGINYFVLAKPGALTLSFAPAKATPSTTTTQQSQTPPGNNYDWFSSKQQFYLSIHEIGDLLAFHSFTTANDVRFFHDPHIGTSEEGKLRKELLIKKNGPGKGYFFNISASANEGGKQSISVPITDGEFNVLITLCQQILPKLLAIDNLTPTLYEEGGEGNEEEK